FRNDARGISRSRAVTFVLARRAAARSIRRMRRVGLLATVLASLVASAAGGEERTQPLLLVLRGRNPLGLERFIARPHRRWLDPHEFGRRFGASPRSLRSATRWLRTQGLRVRHRFADRTMIQFDGPPAAVAAAFGVRLVRAHGRFRSARPPLLHAELGALDVLGLDGVRAAPRFAAGPALAGAGQRISIPAIGDADGAAVANFRAFFGLPPTTLHSIVAGQDPGPGDGPFRTEATLDATWAGAVAPAAQIEVVRGTDLFLIL